MSNLIVGVAGYDHVILFAPFSSVSVCCLELSCFESSDVSNGWCIVRLTLAVTECGLGDAQASLSTCIFVVAYDFRFKYLQENNGFAF